MKPFNNNSFWHSIHVVSARRITRFLTKKTQISARTAGLSHTRDLGWQQRKWQLGDDKPRRKWEWQLAIDPFHVAYCSCWFVLTFFKRLSLGIGVLQAEGDLCHYPLPLGQKRVKWWLLKSPVSSFFLKGRTQFFRAIFFFRRHLILESSTTLLSNSTPWTFGVFSSKSPTVRHGWTRH